MSGKPKRGGTQVAVRAKTSLAEGDAPPLDVGALVAQNRARETQAQLEASQAAFTELCAEHHRLQEKQQHEEREGYEVAALFRREVLAKSGELVALQAEVALGQAALQAAAAAAAGREAQLQAGFAAERQQLAGAAAALQEQLDGLAEFRQHRDGLEAELQRLRAESARAAEESADKVRALHRRVQQLEGDAEAAAGEEGSSGDLHLEADLHRLLAHNRKAADEMQQYSQEAEELQREMLALEAERAGLLRDVRLKEEMEQQYAKRGTLQAREIRSAHTKINTLEKGLAQMASDFEQEKVALEQGLRSQLADAAAELNALRRLLQVRTKELRQVRRLAQEVLLQRCDVEAFLVSSIQQVKAEMAAAGKGTAGTAALVAKQGPTPLPPQLQHQPQPLAGALEGNGAGDEGPAGDAGVSNTGAEASSLSADISTAGGSGIHGGSTSGGSAGPVDIKQLSWEDRERILRLLFGKVNRAAQRPHHVLPAVVRTQALSEAQVEAPAPPPARLRGLATEAGPAGLA